MLEHLQCDHVGEEGLLDSGFGMDEGEHLPADDCVHDFPAEVSLLISLPADETFYVPPVVEEVFVFDGVCSLPPQHPFNLQLQLLILNDFAVFVEVIDVQSADIFRQVVVFFYLLDGLMNEHSPPYGFFLCLVFKF